MKIGFIFLLTILTGSCSNKFLRQKLIPDEYYFPETKIEFGKTFVYLNRNNGDTAYFDLFHSKTNEKTFLIQCSYDKNSVTDSVIFLNRRFVDYYINFLDNGELWKANQISDTVAIDENGALNEIIEFQWKKDSNYTSVRSKDQIVKDTVLRWNGKSYPTIIAKSIIETKSNFLRAPNGNYSFKMEVINYMCKGIGSVRRLVTCSWNSNPVISDLIEIRNVRKNNTGNH
jgi:hypothetical protein